MNPPIPSRCTPLLLAALLIGCSHPKSDGVIGGEVDLRESSLRPGLSARFFPVDNAERYYRFVIDPVQVVPAEGITMNKELRQRIAEHYRRELVSHLAGAYEVVAHGGAGVLRLKAVVHGVRPAAGHGLAGATMEAVVADSVTDRLIIALRDRRPHLDQVNKSLFSEWENAKSIMQAWALTVRGEIKRLGR